MDDGLAHARLNGVLKLIDEWGLLYETRWGLNIPTPWRIRHLTGR